MYVQAASHIHDTVWTDFFRHLPTPLVNIARESRSRMISLCSLDAQPTPRVKRLQLKIDAQSRQLQRQDEDLTNLRSERELQLVRIS